MNRGRIASGGQKVNSRNFRHISTSGFGPRGFKSHRSAALKAIVAAHDKQAGFRGHQTTKSSPKYHFRLVYQPVYLSSHAPNCTKCMKLTRDDIQCVKQCYQCYCTKRHWCTKRNICPKCTENAQKSFQCAKNVPKSYLVYLLVQCTNQCTKRHMHQNAPNEPKLIREYVQFVKTTLLELLYQTSLVYQT